MAETKDLTLLYPNDFLGRRFAELLRWPVFPLLSLTKDFPMRLEEFADDGHLVVRAELPGVDPEKHVEATDEDALLTISGESRSQINSEQKGRRSSEMQYGPFSRTIPLPEAVSEKEVTASYHDGILEVRLALAKPAPPKRGPHIPINH